MKTEKIKIYRNGKNLFFSNTISALLVIMISTFCINTQYVFAVTNGIKKTEWYNPSPNSWYYYDNDGKLVTGLYEVKSLGKTYYFSTDFNNLGLMQTGWKKIGDDTYYFDEYSSEGGLGAKHVGWLKKHRTSSAGYDWYYFDKNGKLITGVYKPEGEKETYYFGTDHVDLGRMKTGMQNIEGKIYFFNKNNTQGSWGAKHTGWLNKQRTGAPGYDWYYFNENGDIVTGWYEKEPNVKYYFSDNPTEYGVMKTGVVNIDGTRYYFKSDGILARNIKIGNYKIDNIGRIV